MRILRISHSGVVDAWRARERVARAAGHQVTSLTARSWDEGGSDVRLRARPGEDVTGVATWGRHPALFLYDPRPLWRMLGEPWDVLDLHEEPFALATAEVLLLRALRRNPVPYLLYTAQNLDKRLPPPFPLLERIALRGASAVSACNSAAAQIVRRRGLAGRAEVIGLGVDPTDFHPGDITDRPRQPLRVGYVGRLDRHKGVAVLLEAVLGGQAADPGLTLTVAGDGPDGPGLRDRVAAAGAGGASRVEFLGPVGHRDLPALYRQWDVVAIPSLTTVSWVEQFGRVAVEAMACGVPVVASDSGALPDVVGGAGVLVPPGSATALRSALQEAGADRARWETMRADGLVRAAHYSWEAIGEEYLSMYQRIASPSQVGRPPVEIIVVAFHGADLLRRALAPVAGLAVTVVDNSSDPEVRDVCRTLGVRYLDSGRNGGFAFGVNHGLRHRRSPQSDVLLLNPDATITPDAITRLQHHLRADPTLASVAPSQHDADGAASRVSWPLPSPVGALLDSIGLGRLRRDAYVIGAVMMLRAEALEQVGGFDEDFFLYAEEADWAARARRLGWRHREVTEIDTLHVGGASSTDGRRRDTHFDASQERYQRKHFGPVGWQVARGAVIAGAAVRTIVRRGQDSAHARDRLRRYLTGPLTAEARLPGQPEVSRR